jgi:hypothetical protein
LIIWLLPVVVLVAGKPVAVVGQGDIYLRHLPQRRRPFTAFQ